MKNGAGIYFAEALGTFMLVFAGTGAIIVNDIYGGIISHAGVAIVWGLTVMTVIYAVGDVSGAYINPAVTIGFWIARRFPKEKVLPYVGSQCLGAAAASFSLKALFPESEGLGGTTPSGPAMQSFALEAILTFYLMLVILCVASGSKEKGVMAGCAVGAVVGLEAMFAGPVSGASMNPARSLGPAVASLNFADLWVYLTAPLVGAFFAATAFQIVSAHSART